MHGTNAALSNAAAIFSACHSQYITQYPEQWHVIRDIHSVILTIDQ
jgi:hypothetical protein